MDSPKSIPPTLIGLSIVIVIQIAGFALLWNEITSQQQYIYLPTENKRGASTGTQTNPIVAVTKFPTEVVLHDAIQSALKQELNPYVRQLVSAPETKQKTFQSESPGVKENSPESIQAFEKITDIVDLAVAKGKWTMADTISASAQSMNITEAQRLELIGKIGNAISNQTLKIDQNALPNF